LQVGWEVVLRDELSACGEDPVLKPGLNVLKPEKPEYD
jgi:hypothetical protein